MKPVLTHPFDVSIKEAKVIQEKLREGVVLDVDRLIPETVAGVDVAFGGGRAYAAFVIFSYPKMELLEETSAAAEIPCPYVPGFLSFREIPVIIEVMRKTKVKPDVIICDGQGVAHPRGMGIASHIGVLFNRPTIGCAKSRLVGEYAEPQLEKGSRAPLWYKGRVVGYVLRTRTKVKPVFISQGNLISLEDAVEIIMGCTKGRRIPEPVRIADIRSKEFKRLPRDCPPTYPLKL